MKISKTHQRLSNRLNNPRVLNHPEEFLGPNWKAILNFWIYLDTLTGEQWEEVLENNISINEDEWYAAYYVAKEAAEKTTPYWNDVYCAANYAECASLELIGSHELLEQQKPFTFILLFLNP